MNYRSVEDLNRAIADNLHRVPDDVSLIVGVPRSGLLPATLLSLQRNLPITDIQGLLEGRLLTGGTRCPGATFEQAAAGRVLVIDDSLCTGAAMRRTREHLAPIAERRKLLFAAVYAAPQSESLVDLCFENVATPRVFEWNVLHHGCLPRSCVDIDGVLCPDPTDEQNDDGPRYLDFLERTRLRFRPEREIGWLVTGRLEKYRRPTEAWLARHGIRYRQLVMLNLPDAGARRKTPGAISELKARVYRESQAVLFIESDPGQAAAIAQLSGRDVYCAGSRRMVFPGHLRQVRSTARRWIGDVHWSLRLGLRHMLGPHVARAGRAA